MTGIRTFLVAFVAAGVAAFALGLLNVYASRHGGQPMASANITMTSIIVAGFAVFIAHQRRANKKLAYADAATAAAALAFAPSAERAVVYVFRDAFFAKLVGFDVEVAGRGIGQTRGKTCYRLELPPGPTTFASINPADGARAETALTLYAGQMVFLEHQPKFGVQASHGLVQVSASQAKPRVRGCRVLVAA